MGSSTLNNSAQKEAIMLAQDAANRGDGLAMIEALFGSTLLEAFEAFFRDRYIRLDPEDIHDIIGISTDELFDRIMKGEKIRVIKNYLWKIIDRKLTEFDINRRQIEELGDNHQNIQDPGVVPEKILLKKAEQKAKLITTAEGLIPRLGQVNVQEVMRYLLIAIKNGVRDVNSNDIADTLGLTPGNVRVAMMRGFERLSRIFKEENLIDESYHFPFIEEMEPYVDSTEDLNSGIN